MDMQGTPIGGNAAGTKVTSDNAQYTKEGTGAIASDSLAAESARRGGALSSEEPMSVAGSRSTLNTTDTSGASTLPPADDAQARDPRRSQKYAEGVGGQGTFHGQHSDQGYAGGPTGERQGGGSYATGLGDAPSGRSANADSAPGYTEDVAQGSVGGQRPKGSNITEGGFDEDAPNASYTTEIGTDQDPGRMGVGNAQRRVAESGADAGGPRQGGLAGGQGGFETLRSEENA
ncbi:MAG: hypothetical protein Q9227_006965 [Pyrenula ochraceoflavens]